MTTSLDPFSFSFSISKPISEPVRQRRFQDCSASFLNRKARVLWEKCYQQCCTGECFDFWSLIRMTGKWPICLYEPECNVDVLDECPFCFVKLISVQTWPPSSVRELQQNIMTGRSYLPESHQLCGTKCPQGLHSSSSMGCWDCKVLGKFETAPVVGGRHGHSLHPLPKKYAMMGKVVCRAARHKDLAVEGKIKCLTAARRRSWQPQGEEAPSVHSRKIQRERERVTELGGDSAQTKSNCYACCPSTASSFLGITAVLSAPGWSWQSPRMTAAHPSIHPATGGVL